MRIRYVILIVLVLSSCGAGEQKKTTRNEGSIKQEYLQKGGEIANQTQAELLRQVSRAISKGGPVYAIEFCNLHALALKDSLSELNNCDIRRIALKYRNPADKPQTKKERKQLDDYLLASQKGETPGPEVFLYSDRIEYYQPIMMAMEACLMCHGDPGKQIADVTLEMIREKYPGDLATGFKMNEFRGAWKITFTRE